MDTFVGLDVSLNETSVCVLNQQGTCVFEGKVASEFKAIACLIHKHARDVVRVGLESGPTISMAHPYVDGRRPSHRLSRCAACPGGPISTA
jgi:hypothetical protein